MYMDLLNNTISQYIEQNFIIRVGHFKSACLINSLFENGLFISHSLPFDREHCEVKALFRSYYIPGGTHSGGHSVGWCLFNNQ